MIFRLFHACFLCRTTTHHTSRKCFPILLPLRNGGKTHISWPCLILEPISSRSQTKKTERSWEWPDGYSHEQVTGPSRDLKRIDGRSFRAMLIELSPIHCLKPWSDLEPSTCRIGSIIVGGKISSDRPYSERLYDFIERDRQQSFADSYSSRIHPDNRRIQRPRRWLPNHEVWL